VTGYATYNEDMSDEERIESCIEFEISQGGNFRAAADAILRDIKRGYILKQMAEDLSQLVEKKGRE
jgi:hypothetical protein